MEKFSERRLQKVQSVREIDFTDNLLNRKSTDQVNKTNTSKPAPEVGEVSPRGEQLLQGRRTKPPVPTAAELWPQRGTHMHSQALLDQGCQLTSVEDDARL